MVVKDRKYTDDDQRPLEYKSWGAANENSLTFG